MCEDNYTFFRELQKKYKKNVGEREIVKVIEEMLYKLTLSMFI